MMTAPALGPISGGITADPVDDGSDLAQISSSTESFLPDAVIDEVIDNSLLPPISSTLMDEDAGDIAFLSMQQLLDDPATGSTADASGCASTSVALEPSIVSGTTDLFEGDLCDDELPSILMSNGSHTYENLQLNPLELVEEVQAEMQQEAAADAEAPTSMVAVEGVEVAQPMELALEETDDKQPQPDKPELQRPVVPFAVVRKLSNAEIVGEKCTAPVPEVTSQKRPADTPSPDAEAQPATKKACTGSPAAAAVTNDGQTPVPAGRITRSRAKLESPIADECVSSPPKKAKKVKSPPKTSLKAKQVSPAATSAITNAPAAPVPQPVASAVVKQEPDQYTKPLAPTPPPTEPVITDTASAPGSDTETSERALPVVTPVGSDEATTAKKLEMANKIRSVASSLPNLPSLSKPTPTTVTKVPTPTKDMVATKAAAAAAALEEPAKKSSRRASTAKAKAEAKTPAQPAITIDTSTAHIQALTGENGASVCLSVRTCTLLQTQVASNNAAEESKPSPPTTTSKPSPPTTTSSSTTPAAAATTAQAPMTEEERAQQSRDRNRKHARNTRLRKKAYVEELKQTLNELVAQRDSAAAEQQQNRQREIEQREVRFRVLEEFLNLRGRNEGDSSRWSAILAPSFSLSLPLTPFQAMVSTTQTIREQTLEGAEEVMEDSCHFAAFLQTLGNNPSIAVPISIEYQCDRKDFMMDGCDAVLAFNAQSVGAVSKGAATELNFSATVRAHFCAESNRLRSTSMMFDTGTIVDQRDAMVASTLA